MLETVSAESQTTQFYSFQNPGLFLLHNLFSWQVMEQGKVNDSGLELTRRALADDVSLKCGVTDV